MTKLLVVPEMPIPADRTGHAIILREGPLDGQTGEHLGDLPRQLELKIGVYGMWTYLRTRETTEVTDFVPGSTKTRTREGRVYQWNGRDPSGNRI
jgi:hypothetical protein